MLFFFQDLQRRETFKGKSSSSWITAIVLMLEAI